MDSNLYISDSRSLLEKIEKTAVLDAEPLEKLSWTLEHIPPQVPPRLHKDLNHCLVQSHNVIVQLFDRLDLADKRMLNAFLGLLLSYGHMRLSFITYNIDSTSDAIPQDQSLYEAPKSKWYDLSPLLPSPSETSSINWKHLMIHTLIIDEPEMFSKAFRLLIQKLHYLNILLSLDNYQGSNKILKAGQNVSEKIGEKILDFAHDDCEIMGVDSFLFNLLEPFTSSEQKAAIIEALVLARLKPQLIDNPQLNTMKGIRKLDYLISEIVMNYPVLQETLTSKLIDQLRCNIIRQKRRHSLDSDESFAGCTLKEYLSKILDSADSVEVIPALTEILVCNKKVQKTYLFHWIDVVSATISKNYLTPKSSSSLTQTCAAILLTTYQIMDEETIQKLSYLMAAIVDSLNPRWSLAFFKSCNLVFLTEFTKAIATHTDLLNDSNSPIRCFYSIYLGKYIKLGSLTKNQQNADRFSSFVNYICDSSLTDQQSRLLQCTLVRELSNFAGVGKILNQYIEHHKLISKVLHKFIKRNLTLTTSKLGEEQESEVPQQSSALNGCVDVALHHKQAMVIDSLVCIIKLAIDRNDQEILDLYGELMLKLYNIACSRVSELTTNIKSGVNCTWTAMDSHLPRLMHLYIKNDATIRPYVCFDLSKKISNLLLKPKDPNDAEQLNSKLMKKEIYNDIKTKLDAVQARAQDSELVYQTLINRQFNPNLDQPVVQPVDKIKHEKACSSGLSGHKRIISESVRIIFHDCDQDIYSDLLQKSMHHLESCDPLDHPRTLFLLLLIEPLMLRPNKAESVMDTIKQIMDRLSSCLLSLTKLVELGPSIHSFTNAGSHKSASAIQCCTYSSCIRLFALIFRAQPPKIVDNLFTDAMQVCVASNLVKYAIYSSRIHHLFTQLASSIAALLKSICISKRQGDSLRSTIPVFLTIFTTLIRCIIIASDRLKLSKHSEYIANGDLSIVENGFRRNDKRDLNGYELSDSYLADLEHLAHDVGRLMNNLSFLEVKLIDFAPHMISSYIKDTQRASCPESVKKHLDEGFYRIFNLVDAYQRERREEVVVAGVQRKTYAARANGSIFDMVYARLDQASREIFRNMHDNYNRFHRYQGKC